MQHSRVGLAAAALGLLACGGMDTVSIPPQARAAGFAYVAAQNLQTGSVSISTFQVDPATATWTSAGLAPVAEPKAGSTGSLLIHRSGRFAYLAYQAPGVVGFGVDPATGALRDLPTSPFRPGGTVVLAQDPGGRFLYTADSRSGIDAFGIDASTGALTALAGSPSATDGPISGLAVEASGRFLYATSRVSGTVTAYAIGGSGALMPIAGPVAAGEQPTSVVATATGFLCVTDVTPLDGVGGLHLYAIDATTGTLTPVPGSPFGEPNENALLVTADPTGRFLYVLYVVPDTAAEKQGYVRAFRIEAAPPALKEITEPQPETGLSPGSLTVSAEGTVLYVVDRAATRNNPVAGFVWGLRIDAANGTLAPLAGFPVPVDGLPLTVAASP